MNCERKCASTAERINEYQIDFMHETKMKRITWKMRMGKTGGRKNSEKKGYTEDNASGWGW